MIRRKIENIIVYHPEYGPINKRIIITYSENPDLSLTEITREAYYGDQPTGFTDFNKVETTSSFSVTATTISGGTIFSGGTDLGLLFLSSSGGEIGGSVTIDGDLTVNGTPTLIGTQNLAVVDKNIYMNSGGTHTTSLGGGLIVLSGISNGNDATLKIDNNGNWVSNTNIYSPNFSGNTSMFNKLSGTTLYSGSTNLDAIIRSLSAGDITRVQPGTNIITGGTENQPTISVSQNPYFSSAYTVSLSAGTISGGTLYSGSTPLSQIIQLFSPTGVVNNVNAGTNVITGGTQNSPIISIVTNPNFINLSAGTITGGTFFSGATPLETIIRSLSSTGGTGGGPSTFVQPGTNIITGGTTSQPIVSVVSSPIFTNVSASTLSATTFFSGSTSLETIINNFMKIPIFDVDNYSAGTSYVGYGRSSGSTKIIRIISSGSNYSALWANGDEILDKNWGNRYVYNYF